MVRFFAEIDTAELSELAKVLCVRDMDLLPAPTLFSREGSCVQIPAIYLSAVLISSALHRG